MHCLHCSKWGLTLSPIQHDFMGPDTMILFTKLSSHCHRVFYHLHYHAIITPCTLIFGRTSIWLGIFYTLSLVTCCRVGCEPKASSSTVRRSTICAISSHMHGHTKWMSCKRLDRSRLDLDDSFLGNNLMLQLSFGGAVIFNCSCLV